MIILFLFLLSVADVACQETAYWLYLKEDVAGKAFMAEIDNGEDQLYYSHWLHAVSILSDGNVAFDTTRVRKITQQATFETTSGEDQDSYGFALEQIDASRLTELGLTGKGVKIGVIDGGFLNADKDPSLGNLFSQDLIKEYRDFITPNMDAYGGSKGLDDRHGTDVLQLIGGLNSKTGVRHGLATRSEFFLARTDHGASEKQIEEVYLIQALEWLDSLGVRLVNISLGYTDGFENKEHDYTPENMDGSSAIARAVQVAHMKKGMLVVTAAGNDGAKEWQVISTPADAVGALTVGATKLKHWDKMTFSSIGPELDYLKPEISCFASQGTSFSTPVITGLAALIWENQPDLTNKEVKNLIVRSGHLFPYGNNYIGYGVPTAQGIVNQLEGEIPTQPMLIRLYRNQYRFASKQHEHMVIYQKKDRWHVLEENYVRLDGKRPSIKRLPGAQFTTVILDNDQVFELQWMRDE